MESQGVLCKHWLNPQGVGESNRTLDLFKQRWDRGMHDHVPVLANYD